MAIQTVLLWITAVEKVAKFVKRFRGKKNVKEDVKEEKGKSKKKKELT